MEDVFQWIRFFAFFTKIRKRLGKYVQNVVKYIQYGGDILLKREKCMLMVGGRFYDQ